MSSPLRYVAPAGAPIRVTDLGRWLSASLSRGDASAALEDLFRSRFGVDRAFLASTGRAGLTLLLQALRRIAPEGRVEVVLPSYTCYSVLASVVKAGLRPRIVDIASDTLDYAPEALAAADLSRALAIVATNLYGLPNDLPALERAARQNGAFLIDDAAQAMGAKVGGRWSGTWGDAGLYSFDKGKNVSAIDGGVIVTRSPAVAAALDDEMRSVPAPGAKASVEGVVKALAYFVLLRPWLYGIPNRIPQLELGKTVFTTEFPLERPPAALVSLARTMMRRLDEFTDIRRANAARLLDALRPVGDVRPIRVTNGATPVYLRLPLLMRSEQARDQAIGRLRAAGIGATGSYPASLADIPELGAGSVAADGGRELARRILTVPTHAFVSPADVDRTVRVLAAGNPVSAGAAATVSVR